MMLVIKQPPVLCSEVGSRFRSWTNNPYEYLQPPMYTKFVLYPLLVQQGSRPAWFVLNMLCRLGLSALCRRFGVRCHWP